VKIRLGVAACLMTAGAVVAAGSAAMAGSTAVAPAAIVAGTGSFGTIHPVRINTGSSRAQGPADMSCAPHARCAVVINTPLSSTNDVFLLSDSAGTWGPAERIPGLTRGKEQTEKIAVHVTGPRTPTAKVTVKSGSTTVGTITLNASGVGTCFLTASQLAVGTYHLVASYPGSYGLARSSSTSVPVTVVK
jgi:hypothetical protein